MVCIVSSAFFVDYGKAEEVDKPYYVDYARDVALSGEHGHRFCGPHDIDGAWCPNCDKALLRFLTLDTADLRLGLEYSPVRLIHLLFCWECNVAQGTVYPFHARMEADPNFKPWFSLNPRGVTWGFEGDNDKCLWPYSVPFFYRLLDSGSVELLQYVLGDQGGNFPYEKYPSFFPGANASLLRLTEETQSVLFALNSDEVQEWDINQTVEGLARPRHQVGGEPYLVQKNPETSMNCPKC